MHTQFLRSSGAGILLAAVLAQAAVAAGEPKNELPFTRPVASRTAQSATHTAQSATHAAPASPLIQGEPKNDRPFTRPVAQPATIVLRGSSGFSWIDGAIGLVAGLGVAVVGIGAAALARGAQRGAPRTAL